MRKTSFRFPRLSRRGKLVRNLLIAFCLVTGSWVLAGCPAWTQAGALRQFERTMLLSPGTLRYQEAGDMMGDTLVLVTGEGYAYTAELRRDETFLWPEVYYFGLELAPLGEDPLPIPLSRGRLWYRDESAILLCLNAPEGTARAEMALTGDYVHTVGEYQGDVEHILERREETLTFYGQGEALDEDLVRLDFTAEDEEQQDVLSGLLHGSGELGQITDGQSSHWVPQATRYQVDFYRADGGLIGSIQGDWDGGA